MEMKPVETILGNLSELDKNKEYVFNIDTNDMPKDVCISLLRQVKECLDKVGIKCIYVPIRENSGGLITVDEWLEQNKEYNNL